MFGTTFKSIIMAKTFCQFSLLFPNTMAPLPKGLFGCSNFFDVMPLQKYFQTVIWTHDRGQEKLRDWKTHSAALPLSLCIFFRYSTSKPQMN